MADNLELLAELRTPLRARDVACVFEKAGLESLPIPMLKISDLGDGGIRLFNYQVADSPGLDESIATQFETLRAEYETVVLAKLGSGGTRRSFELVHNSDIHRLSLHSDPATLDAVEQAAKRLFHASGQSPEITRTNESVTFRTAAPDILMAAASSSRIESLAINKVGMEPTLELGDSILWQPMVVEPRRGQLVVVETPTGERVVLRVAGLAGDKVAFKNGFLERNGTTISTQHLGEYELRGFDPRTNAPRKLAGRIFAETSGEATYRTSRYSDTNPAGEWSVNKGEVLLLGDNRDFSNDSRTFGLRPLGSIVGIPILIWWSLFDKTIRTERMGTAPH